VTAKRQFWRRRRDLEKERAERYQRAAQRRAQRENEIAQWVGILGEMPDDELMEQLPTGPGASDSLSEMEMQRRLKSAIYSLIDEIVTFRESSEAADERLTAQTSWLISFTWVLIALTVAVAILTGALLIKG
jgi:hypothetical protein